MNILRFILILLISGQSINVSSQKTVSQRDSIRDALEYQMTNYPVSQYRDVYKNFMQDFYGPGHLLNDTTASGRYLRSELSETDIFEGPDFEPTGYKGNFYRVNLRLIADGTISYDKFFKAFVQSVQGIVPPSAEEWMDTWRIIDGEIKGMGLKFDNEEADRKELAEQFEEGNFVVHHSRAYNDSVNFHYRIISGDIFEEIFFPLISNAKSKK